MRKFVATITSRGHQHIIEENFRVLDAIGYTIKYYKYNTDNDWFFSGIDLGLFEISLFLRVEKQKFPRMVDLYLLILMRIIKFKYQRKPVPPMIGTRLLPSVLMTNYQGKQKYLLTNGIK